MTAFAKALAGLLLVVLLAGCASDQHPIVWIQNRTDTVVRVSLVRVGESEGSVITTGIQPGGGCSYDFIAEGCDDRLELIAKDAAGVVVWRGGAPVCRPSTVTIKN